MATTVSMTDRQDIGSQTKVRAAVTLGTYATNGVTINASDFGISIIEGASCEDSEGYTFDVDIATGGATALIKAYRTGATSIATEAAHTHAAGAITGSASYTPAGTVTGKLDLAVPSFSGTGYSTVGQVVTTTDNQTMPAVDTAAGMWFIGATPAEPPVLIVSNTIVAGAPAVLTCVGVPPVTNAGAYKIVTLGAATFTGTPATITPSLTGAATAAGSAHTHTATAAAMSEVTNGVSLAAVVINMDIYGR